MIHDYISRITTSVKLSALRNLVHYIIEILSVSKQVEGIDLPNARSA
jgi:hypothetical protein